MEKKYWNSDTWNEYNIGSCSSEFLLSYRKASFTSNKNILEF